MKTALSNAMATKTLSVPKPAQSAPVTTPAAAPKPSDPLAYLQGKKVCVRTRGVARFIGTLFKSSGQFYTLRNAEEIDGDIRNNWPELTHIDRNCVMFIAEVA